MAAGIKTVFDNPAPQRCVGASCSKVTFSTAIDVGGRWRNDRPDRRVAFRSAAHRDVPHPHSHAIQSRGMLDLDHFDAQSGEETTGTGAGQHPRQVDDTDPAMALVHSAGPGMIGC